HRPVASHARPWPSPGLLESNPRPIERTWRRQSAPCRLRRRRPGRETANPRREISVPALCAHPMETVPFATTFPSGKSSGSLQVIALSPLRAALLPLIFTVELPNLIVALLAGGGFKKETRAAGEGGGGCCAVW